MSGMTVLVTGVTRFLGSSLAGRLAAHPSVDRVIGVDAALPDPAARARMGRAEFARADIRNPLIARVIEAAGVDTVVHASASAAPVASAARTMAKEMNVLGTMQLLAACQRSETVANVIVRSTSAVYGASSKDPAIFTEETSPRAMPSSGPARDAVDIEGYVRGFGRRRPDVRIALPRFADVIGPTVRTPLTRYFSLAPLIPVPFGHDSRLQFVHEQDAVDLLEHLVLGRFAGIVNVAGDGVLTLDQAIHRAGRVPWPVPMVAMDSVSRLMKLARISGFSTQQVKLLTAGRVLDTTRLRTHAGFVCRYTTAEAFAEFAATIRPAVSRRLVRLTERGVAGALGVSALPDGPEPARDSGRVPPVLVDDGPRRANGRPQSGAEVPSVGSRPPDGPRLVGLDGMGGSGGLPRRRRPR
jgi:UDP-glucose 4-epimerase